MCLKILYVNIICIIILEYNEIESIINEMNFITLKIYFFLYI